MMTPSDVRHIHADTIAVSDIYIIYRYPERYDSFALRQPMPRACGGGGDRAWKKALIYLPMVQTLYISKKVLSSGLALD